MHFLFHGGVGKAEKRGAVVVVRGFGSWYALGFTERFHHCSVQCFGTAKPVNLLRPLSYRRYGQFYLHKLTTNLSQIHGRLQSPRRRNGQRRGRGRGRCS